MKKTISLAVTLAATMALAVGPSFHEMALPQEWTVGKGQAVSLAAVQAADGKTLDLLTTNLLAAPLEATFRFRATPGDEFAVRALEEQKDAKPLLEFTFEQQAGNHARVEVKSGGAPMATLAKSCRRWDYRNKKTGALDYAWRFPKVQNLWDERDYKEIGSANARLTPFAEKVFTLRMVLASTTRQIWLDDRLVAEDRVASDKPARWAIHLAKSAQVLSAEFSTPAGQGSFLPLALEHYSHLKSLQCVKADSSLTEIESIPMRVSQTAAPDIHLGDSLDRYRLTFGSGPNAGYENTWCSWMGSFTIDPALLTFRVPYRNYQNAWLLAWVDDRTNTVARGTLQFFQQNAGYPAGTDFSISPEAISKGLVKKLSRKTADGKELYLVKVPLDTAGLYGMRDREDQFLEFQLTKPVALRRSYPDPIFYGYFPAGLPSSIHVVGITLEEAPFGIQVDPKEAMFIFAQPEKPVVTVSVTNTTDHSFRAEIRAETASYDGREKKSIRESVKVEAGKSGSVDLSFDLSRFGWHDLKISVEAKDVRREATLSLVLLPPDKRTHGEAVNESRFGMWGLEGHYTSIDETLKPNGLDDKHNVEVAAAYRKLGLVHIANAHSVGRNFAKWNTGGANDEDRKKAISNEVGSAAHLVAQQASPIYFYGGEWGIGSEALDYGPWPLYTGDGEQPLPEEVRKAAETQVQIFTAIGHAIHDKYPQVRRFLQWGAPAGSLAHLHAGIGKDVVDGFGMDAPMFELLPEVSNALGGINALWMLKAEAKRLGWPELPVAWTEGPFFPTCPGALDERDQMDYQIRYLLMGLGFKMDAFVSGIVPQDAGNYYGAEHYGAGICHRYPLENPKPAVAAVATMTAMLCGADPVGGIDTGCLTTYCLGFQHASNKSKVFALWRVRGTSDARIKVRGTKAVVTDAMGNAVETPVKDGAIVLSLSPSPVWLTGVEAIDGFELAPPVYDTAPAAVTRPLPALTANNWVYDGSEDKAYASNHFAVRRVTDSNLQAVFGQDEKDHASAVAITLPVEPGDRPLANRYGALKPKKPVSIPGKARALGIWVKGNSSWGRVIYQLRDAKGEIWTAIGTKDNWNCDDTHGWSYVNFEGWRYVRFPLPGNQPWDAAHDLEITWWGSHGSSSVNLPLTLEKIIVEARNEVPVLGEMKTVPERTYKISGLVAEYDSEEDATPAVVARNQLRMPVAEWTGPEDNPIARLATEGVGAAPELKTFEEPMHFNDGRQMHVRFAQDLALKYNLYVTRFADGRGADLLVRGVADNQLVGGLRPETTMYFFLTSVDAQKKESKPSNPFRLVTHDKFLEK